METINELKRQNIVERTFEFGVRIIRLCAHLDEKRGVGRVLGPQILKAGTSIGSMVEEARAAESRADFISKMSIGLKEARETHYRLRLLVAAPVLPSSRLSGTVAEADEIRRILGAIIVASKRNTRAAKPPVLQSARR